MSAIWPSIACCTVLRYHPCPLSVNIIGKLAAHAGLLTTGMTELVLVFLQLGRDGPHASCTEGNGLSDLGIILTRLLSYNPFPLSVSIIGKLAEHAGLLTIGMTELVLIFLPLRWGGIRERIPEWSPHAFQKRPATTLQSLDSFP